MARPSSRSERCRDARTAADTSAAKSPSMSATVTVDPSTRRGVARASRRPCLAPSDRRAPRGRLRRQQPAPRRATRCSGRSRYGREREPGSGHDDPVRDDPVDRVDHGERDEHGAEARRERSLRRSRPKTAKHATMSSAVTASTSGYVGEIRVSQCRQRPRSSAYESERDVVAPEDLRAAAPA